MDKKLDYFCRANGILRNSFPYLIIKLIFYSPLTHPISLEKNAPWKTKLQQIGNTTTDGRFKYDWKFVKTVQQLFQHKQAFLFVPVRNLAPKTAEQKAKILIY